MGVPFVHRFASKSNRTARRWLRELSAPEILYVTHRATAPRVDLYVCGPPCPQLSGMNQHGFAPHRSVAKVSQKCHKNQNYRKMYNLQNMYG